VGADLIGFIYVGPQKMDEWHKKNAIRELTEVIREVKRSKRLKDKDETYPCLELFDDDPENFLSEFPGSDSHRQASKFVNLFCRFWEGKLRTRDTMSRYYTTGEEVQDKKIVAVGDRTWGDEPDGEGYRLMKLVSATGLARHLGME